MRPIAFAAFALNAHQQPTAQSAGQHGQRGIKTLANPACPLCTPRVPFAILAAWHAAVTDKLVDNSAMAPTSLCLHRPTRHTTAESALAQVHHIYNHQMGLLRDHMQRFVAGETLPSRVRACYPYVRIQTDTVARAEPQPRRALWPMALWPGPAVRPR